MRTSAPSNDGFALLMVILLLALLSGAVLQSLVSVRLTLRSEQERQTRLMLRSALLDAAWAAMRIGMKAGAASTEYQVFEHQLPTGIHTRIALQGLPREALPLPLQRPDLPVFGQLFSLSAKADAGPRVSSARALACRLPTGTVRVLAWVEHP
jgi:type II secretory pathway pseudopilin PulG